MKRCNNCKKCPQNMKNRNITIVLLFYSFIIAMIVFAAMRMMGIFYFVQTYVDVKLSPLYSRAIMFVYHTFEGVLILRILTPLKIGHCVLTSTAYKILLYFIYGYSNALLFCCDLAYIFIIALVVNKDKVSSFIHSFDYALLMGFYQNVMRYGRYSMEDGKGSAVWAVISTIDYKLFLIVILLGKELVKMDDSHCFLWWGKFDSFCKLIGMIIISPFSKNIRAQVPAQCDIVKTEFKKHE